MALIKEISNRPKDIKDYPIFALLLFLGKQVGFERVSIYLNWFLLFCCDYVTEIGEIWSKIGHFGADGPKIT